MTIDADWLTPQQVGNMVGGFSAQFVRDEIRAGELHAEYIRSRSGKMGYYRIRRAEAIAYQERLARRSSTHVTPDAPDTNDTHS